MRTPVFEPQGSTGTRNLTFGAPGRGAPESYFLRPTFRRVAASMSGDPTANSDRWAAWPAHAVPPAQGDLNPVTLSRNNEWGCIRPGVSGVPPSGLTGSLPRLVAALSSALVRILED